MQNEKLNKDKFTEEKLQKRKRKLLNKYTKKA